MCYYFDTPQIGTNGEQEYFIAIFVLYRSDEQKNLRFTNNGACNMVCQLHSEDDGWVWHATRVVRNLDCECGAMVDLLILARIALKYGILEQIVDY